MQKYLEIDKFKITVRYLCPKDKRYYSCSPESHELCSSDDECELCGSHGEISLRVTCKCGKEHQITFKSW